METDEVQGNHGVALAATSKNGKYDNATRLIDAPFVLQRYATYA
jgi:hypothetical protein